MKKSIILFASSCALLSTHLFAANLQLFNVVNSLYNQDATAGAAGQTPTSVLIKFFTNGATTPCFTATLAYQGSLSVSTGTGNACSTAVTSISFAPVAVAVIGTTYAAPASFTPTVGQFSTQITIAQQTKSGSTSYGPVFDTTNGLVVTPGIVSINAQ